MDDYELAERIGGGSYGSVHLALDRRIQRWFCLKQIDLALQAEKEQRQAEGEVRVLSKLNHPGVVRYHDHFVHDSKLCIVMECCEGGDLASCIRRRAKRSEHFSQEEVLDALVQLIDALKYIHDQRILHRDLKTQNVFLTHDGRLQIGDFGISKILEGSAAATVIGTPFYMSPEICRGERYDYKSDLWALGCIVHEMCALQPAWKSTNMLSVVYKIVEGRPTPRPSNLYTAELHALIDALLSKDPRSRPSLSEINELPVIRRWRHARCQEPSTHVSSVPPAESTAHSTFARLISGLLGKGRTVSDAKRYVCRNAAGSPKEDDELIVALARDRSRDMDGNADGGAPIAAKRCRGGRRRWRREAADLACAVEAGQRASTEAVPCDRRPEASAGGQLQRRMAFPRRSTRLVHVRAQRDDARSPLALLQPETGDQNSQDLVFVQQGTTIEGGRHSSRRPASAGRGPQSEWYYLDAHGGQHGPVDEEMLLLMHALGEIEDETQVWNKLRAQWERIVDQPGLLYG